MVAGSPTHPLECWRLSPGEPALARRCCWPPRLLGLGRTGCAGTAACATPTAGARSGPTAIRPCPLEASGASISAPGDPRLGVVSGIVTKRAARLRVYFRTGRPLELVPVDAGDRFPVNFYAGLYRQPKHGQPPLIEGVLPPGGSPAPGMWSGWWPMTRPAVGSPSISTGAAEPPADPGLFDCGKRLPQSASLRNSWSAVSREIASQHGGLPYLPRTEMV
jgi:hypothetical protein